MNIQLDKEEYDYYAEQARKEAYYDMPYYDHVLWSKERKLKLVFYEPGKQRQASKPYSAVSSTNTCNICKKTVPKRRRFCDSCKKKQSNKKRGKRRSKKSSGRRSLTVRVKKRAKSGLIQL